MITWSLQACLDPLGTIYTTPVCIRKEKGKRNDLRDILFAKQLMSSSAGNALSDCPHFVSLFVTANSGFANADRKQNLKRIYRIITRIVKIVGRNSEVCENPA